MDRKFVTFGIIVCLSLGLVVGYFGGQNNNSEEITKLKDHLDETQDELSKAQSNSDRFLKAQEKLKIFTEKQMEEYRALKDQKSKYLKAEEILGKMMVIFLADLSIHLSNKNKDWIKESRVSANENIGKTNKKKSMFDVKEYEESLDRLDSDPDESYIPPNLTSLEEQDLKKYLNEKAKKFQRFSDFYRGGIQRSLVSSQYKKLLFTKKYLTKDLKPVPRNLLKFYEGSKGGTFRRGRKTEIKLYYSLKYIKENKDGIPIVSLKFSTVGKNSTYIMIKENYLAMHPVDHNDHGSGGACRFLVLRPVDGTAELFLSYTKQKKTIFGKMVNYMRTKKGTPVGYFNLTQF